jgi:hypothetical protein
MANGLKKSFFIFLLVIGIVVCYFACDDGELIVEIPIINPTPTNTPTPTTNPNDYEAIDCGNNSLANLIIEYMPGAGQFINNTSFNNPNEICCEPTGGTTMAPDNSSMLTLGGFGGYVIFKFPDKVANESGYDLIFYGNAFWNGDNPQNRWIEPGYIEVSVDENSNGLADDKWYLIPGSHITDSDGDGDYEEHKETQIYHTSDTEYLPENKSYYPDSQYYPDINTTSYSLTAYRLPDEICGTVNNPDPVNESVWGYADVNPNLLEGQYLPDDPTTVGIDADTRGGDAVDIDNAIDPNTGEQVNLPQIDFIKITNGCNVILGTLGEVSAEIDAVYRIW